jgi:hypothetical protein
MNVVFLYVLYLTNIYNQKSSKPIIHPLLLSASIVRAKFGPIFGHKPCLMTYMCYPSTSPKDLCTNYSIPLGLISQ